MKKHLRKSRRFYILSENPQIYKENDTAALSAGKGISFLWSL
jgi:hypothetical protein